MAPKKKPTPTLLHRVDTARSTRTESPTAHRPGRRGSAVTLLVEDHQAPPPLSAATTAATVDEEDDPLVASITHSITHSVASTVHGQESPQCQSFGKRRSSVNSRPGSSSSLMSGGGARRARPESVSSAGSDGGRKANTNKNHVRRGSARSTRSKPPTSSSPKSAALSKGPAAAISVFPNVDKELELERTAVPEDRKRGGGPHAAIPFCTEHPSELLHIYCMTCNQAVCDVCFHLYHTTGGEEEEEETVLNVTSSEGEGEVDALVVVQEGVVPTPRRAGVFYDAPAVRHRWKFLGDVTATSRRLLNPILNHTGQVHNDLHKLIEEIPNKEHQLHRYVDEQTNEIEHALEAKRRELHQDATQRASQMELLIMEELQRCQQELDVLEDGQAVLRALSLGEGVVGEGQLGQLILGHMDYQEFHATIHKPLHAAERMLSSQGLQLPVQDLQSMCSMVDWTPLSVSNTPQLFP